MLIDAQRVGFSVPVIEPKERSILADPSRLLKDFYFSRHGRKSQTILSDLTFTLAEGQRLAVIGANGAGKSTLLRLLGGIYHATSGKLVFRCRPRGLFDISAGFNLEATGLENIYLRGLDMGFSLEQIRRKIPEVLDFSGLGVAIDRPFHSFSTGMRLRLAVAMALIEQPDVMLLDEWIGSGDADFQSKVAARMEAFVGGARGLVLASHSDKLLQRVCTQGMVMHKGHIVFQGSIGDALTYYNKRIRVQKNAPVQAVPGRN